MTLVFCDLITSYFAASPHYIYLFEDLVLECFEKAKHKKSLLPLQSQGLYQILYYSPPKANDSRSPSPIGRKHWMTTNAPSAISRFPIEPLACSSTLHHRRLSSPSMMTNHRLVDIRHAFAKEILFKQQNSISIVFTAVCLEFCC